MATVLTKKSEGWEEFFLVFIAEEYMRIQQKGLWLLVKTIWDKNVSNISDGGSKCKLHSKSGHRCAKGTLNFTGFSCLLCYRHLQESEENLLRKNFITSLLNFLQCLFSLIYTIRAWSLQRGWDTNEDGEVHGRFGNSKQRSACAPCRNPTQVFSIDMY